MRPDDEEDTAQIFERLLRESRDRDVDTLRRSQQAIEESRELLKRVKQDHPGL